jgi:dihydroorotate dehydrogenase electron transfer subunit
MAKHIDFLEIIDNKSVNFDIFILKLLSDSKLPEMRPGQFVQVKVEGSPETFLRRPLSVHDVNYKANSIELLVQIAGKGTERLSLLRKGEKINIIYPLGNSFSLPSPGMKTILIGGGCGIAPLLFLGKYLKSNGYSPDILLGFRNSKRIIEYEEYQKLGRVFLTTEDGSKGEKGFVTDHPVLNSEVYNKVYCCGPEPMMKSVAGYCRKKKIPCEVSLENLMGCGIGACLCCVVDTVRGNLCSCTDGPVFNVNDLKW